MLFASPDPTQTMLELAGATATSPVEAIVPPSSNAGCQVTPPFIVCQIPPVAAARYATVPSWPPRVPGDSATAMSTTRPLITAGPIDRTRSELTSAESVSAAPAPPPRPPRPPACGVAGGWATSGDAARTNNADRIVERRRRECMMWAESQVGDGGTAPRERSTVWGRWVPGQA